MSNDTILGILENISAEMNWDDEVRIIHLVGFLQDLADHPGLTPGELIPEFFSDYLGRVSDEEKSNSILDQ